MTDNLTSDRPPFSSETHTDGLLFLLNCYDVWSATPAQTGDACVDCFGDSVAD